MIVENLPLYLICIFFFGCAAPGTPIIRDAASDGDGPIIPNCYNVSLGSNALTLPNRFIKNRYLTTWGSAWSEGAREGYREELDKTGLGGSGGDVQLFALLNWLSGREAALSRLRKSPASAWPERVNTLAESPTPFCNYFFASSLTIFDLVEKVFQQLDYPMALVDRKSGVLETGFVERKHGAARWRDRYVVYVNPTLPSESTVIVFRSVFIDRSGNVFNEAKSAGHNEAWIIGQVVENLKRD
jgi:hypothetical protein